jgi:hypothetical protein
MDVFYGHDWETLTRANVYPPRWLIVQDGVAAAPHWVAPAAPGLEAGLDADFSAIALAQAATLLDRGRQFLTRPSGLPLRRLATPPPEAHGGGGLWFVRPDDSHGIPIAIRQGGFDVFAHTDDQVIGMGWENSSYVLLARGHLLIAVLSAFPGFGARFPLAG